MSCNGCRVLRKGCSESCVLRPCLEWIESPEAQGNATVFVAKFFGRAGLMEFISAVPDYQRTGLFRSLLYEACGRTVNPVHGAVGLLWSGNWHVCEEAVKSVLRGETLRPHLSSVEDSSVALYSKARQQDRHHYHYHNAEGSPSLKSNQINVNKDNKSTNISNGVKSTFTSAVCDPQLRPPAAACQPNVPVGSSNGVLSRSVLPYNRSLILQASPPPAVPPVNPSRFWTSVTLTQPRDSDLHPRNPSLELSLGYPHNYIDNHAQNPSVASCCNPRLDSRSPNSLNSPGSITAPDSPQFASSGCKLLHLLY